MKAVLVRPVGLSCGVSRRCYFRLRPKSLPVSLWVTRVVAFFAPCCPRRLLSLVLLRGILASLLYCRFQCAIAPTPSSGCCDPTEVRFWPPRLTRFNPLRSGARSGCSTSGGGEPPRALAALQLSGDGNDQISAYKNRCQGPWIGLIWHLFTHFSPNCG